MWTGPDGDQEIRDALVLHDAAVTVLAEQYRLTYGQPVYVITPDRPSLDPADG
jgi:hypothetical protein